MKIGDYTITSIETISAFNCTTGAFKYALDELQNAGLSQSQEKTDITGKQGRKINSLKKNKSVKVTATNGLISNGLLADQVGSDFVNEVTTVRWHDFLTVDASHKATTTYKATGTTGAEIVTLYVLNDDGTIGATLTQNATAGDGQFKYTPGTKEIECHTNIEEGTQLVAYYDRKIQADVQLNKSDKYSEKSALYIDALGEDKCTKLHRIQIYIPQADVSGEFSLDMGDNQTVHSFEAEALAGACGGAGEYWKYVVFGADAADAE